MGALLALGGAFLLTVVLEGGALLLAVRRWRPVYVSFLCNLLTNPTANALVAGLTLWLGVGAYFPCLLVTELAVVWAEAAVYRLLLGLPWRRAALWSLGLNAFSCLAGLVIW